MAALGDSGRELQDKTAMVEAPGLCRHRALIAKGHNMHLGKIGPVSLTNTL